MRGAFPSARSFSVARWGCCVSAVREPSLAGLRVAARPLAGVAGPGEGPVGRGSCAESPPPPAGPSPTPVRVGTERRCQGSPGAAGQGCPLGPPGPLQGWGVLLEFPGAEGGRGGGPVKPVKQPREGGLGGRGSAAGPGQGGGAVSLLGGSSGAQGLGRERRRAFNACVCRSVKPNAGVCALHHRE